MEEYENRYRALRRNIRRRALALKKAGYIEGEEMLTPGTELYLKSVTEIRNAPYMQTLSAEEKTRAWEHAIRIAEQTRERPGLFLSDKGKLTKATLKAINTLQDRGYRINRGNISSFGRFMDRMRHEYGKRMRFSEMMVEFFDDLNLNAQRGNLDTLVRAWEEYRDNDFEFTDEQDRIRAW